MIFILPPYITECVEVLLPFVIVSHFMGLLFSCQDNVCDEMRDAGWKKE